MTEKQSHDFMLSGYEETGENIPELISLKLIEKIKDGRWEVKVTVGDGEPRQKNILNKIKELQRKQKEAYYGLYNTRWNRWRKHSQNEIIKSMTFYNERRR